jgi:tRNA(fMet)-specific endonuclease VapC
MTILDSDIVTLYSYGNENVLRHVDAVPEEEPLAITVITRMEVLKGRTDSVLKAADEKELRAAAERLQKTEAMLDDFLLLPVDEEAVPSLRPPAEGEETQEDEAA